MRSYLFTILAICTLTGAAQNCSELFKQGVNHINNKEYSEAAQVLEQTAVLAGEGVDFGILVNLAYSQLMTGKPEKAVANYSKALELRPKEYEVLFQRANAYLMLKRTDKAIEDCNSIIKAQPENCDALLTLAQAYSENLEFEKAKEQFVRVITLAPHNNDAN